MRVVAIIAARMGSTRLPGKVLQDIGGETMLARVVRRTQGAARVDKVLVATTTEEIEEPLLAECERLGVDVFRGSEQDVLDRIYGAALANDAQAVVRITSDCPLIDSRLIDRVVLTFLDLMPDYASNVLERSYPRGLDAEVVAFSALERAWREAPEPYQRAHVTPYIYQNPGQFRLISVTDTADRSRYRWTVDTEEDLAFVREIYRRFSPDSDFSWTDVLALLSREPGLTEINRSIQQKVLSEG